MEERRDGSQPKLTFTPDIRGEAGVYIPQQASSAIVGITGIFLPIGLECNMSKNDQRMALTALGNFADITRRSILGSVGPTK